MMKRMLRGDKKGFFVTFALIFVCMTLLFLISTMLKEAEVNRDKRNEVDFSENSLIASEVYFINYKIERITSDLDFVYNTLQLNFPADGDFSNLEKLWLAYSDNRKVYNQIRFIDTQGDEVLRVDYTKGGAQAIPQDQLQNKKDRYYFQQTIGLERGQIYISPLDLNIERGAIELPINPAIRLAQPFFDQNGIKRGIVILNYSASDILKQIASIAKSSYGNVFFLNNEGYWLYNTQDPVTEWAFSYDPASSVKFPSDYPTEWEMISADGSGMLTTDNGYFRYATIPFGSIHTTSEEGSMISCDMGNWYIVSFIPAVSGTSIYPSSKLSNLAVASFQQYYLIYAMIVLISGLLAGFATSSRSKSKQVKFFSEYDAMTNAYNRRAGIEKLFDVYKSLSKVNCVMSVCFIDINGLKEVNDTLGHESGDELIITVTNTIRAHIRSDDFLIRLGGDEFLIAFQGIDETLAEAAWSRIVTAFDSINNTEQRRYLISVSHGIQVLNCTVNQILDNVLHEADAKMYEEKRQIKSALQIIRN